MTPSARTYRGIILIFFGGATAFGARGQHAVDFPFAACAVPRFGIGGGRSAVLPPFPLP